MLSIFALGLGRKKGGNQIFVTVGHNPSTCFRLRHSYVGKS